MKSRRSATSDVLAEAARSGTVPSVGSHPPRLPGALLTTAWPPRPAGWVLGVAESPAVATSWPRLARAPLPPAAVAALAALDRSTLWSLVANPFLNSAAVRAATSADSRGDSTAPLFALLASPHANPRELVAALGNRRGFAAVAASANPHAAAADLAEAAGVVDSVTVAAALLLNPALPDAAAAALLTAARPADRDWVAHAVTVTGFSALLRRHPGLLDPVMGYGAGESTAAAIWHLATQEGAPRVFGRRLRGPAEPLLRVLAKTGTAGLAKASADQITQVCGWSPPPAVVEALLANHTHRTTAAEVLLRHHSCPIARAKALAALLDQPGAGRADPAPFRTIAAICPARDDYEILLDPRFGPVRPSCFDDPAQLLRLGVGQALNDAELGTLAELLTDRLGNHRASWQIFVDVGQNFTKSLGALLDLCDDVLPADTRID